MSALHVFDMDGTLLRGTTASLEIARRLDRVAPLEALEAQLGAGEISTADFAAGVHELWGDLTPDLVTAVASDAPWIDGITEVCADIAGRGETSMLITMSPDFFAEHLRPRGLDVVHASRFPPLPFRVAVDPAGILTPDDKVRLTDAERRRRGLAPEAVVAYGDSLSDRPLFAALDNTVAINADPDLEAVARLAYRGDDLREPYARARTLLGASA